MNLESFSHAKADLIPSAQIRIVPIAEISPDSLALRGMKINKVFNGKGPVLWVLIRDIHCQAQAQERIAITLEQLARENLLDQVLVEGASGPVQTLLYEIFPDKDARTQVARKFLRQGLLTGAEFSKIVMGLKNETSLYGVEEPHLYSENFKAFHLCRKYAESLKEGVSAIDAWLQSLKDKAYSSDLKRIDQFSKSLHSNSPKWQEWVKELEFIFKSHPHLLAKTSSLKDFLTFFQETNAFDSKEAQTQLDQLIKDLQTRLSPNAFKEIVKITLEYRLGHIKADEYLAQLKQNYEKENSVQKDLFQKEYPQLQTWLSISQKEKKFDFDVLWNELISFVQGFLYEQARLEKVEDIADFDETWKIFKKLIRLELTRRELETTGLKGFKNTQSRAITMQALSQKYNVQDLNLENSQIIHQFDDCMREALKFYEFALKRDEVMAEKALMVTSRQSRVPSQKTQNSDLLETGDRGPVTVLITGGFHTEGIQKILEKKKISYIACTPEIRGELGFKRYDFVMKTQWDEIHGEEFSKDRLLLRPSSDPIKKMLSPVSAMEREIHEQLELDEGHILKPLLKELIDVLSKADQKTVHQIVNRWFKKHRDILRDLDDKEGRILVEVISKHKNCTLQWDRFNPNMKTAGRLVVAAVARRWGEESGIVKFGRWYFKKTEKEEVKKGFLRRAFHILGRVSQTLLYYLVLPFVVFICLIGAHFTMSAALTLVLLGIASEFFLTPLYRKLPKKVQKMVGFAVDFYIVLNAASLLSIYLGLPFLTLLIAPFVLFNVFVIFKWVGSTLKKTGKTLFVKFKNLRRQRALEIEEEKTLSVPISEDQTEISLNPFESLSALTAQEEQLVSFLASYNLFSPAVIVSPKISRNPLDVWEGKNIFFLKRNQKGQVAQVVRGKSSNLKSTEAVFLRERVVLDDDSEDGQSSSENLLISYKSATKEKISLDEIGVDSIFLKEGARSLTAQNIDYPSEILKILIIRKKLQNLSISANDKTKNDLFKKIQALDQYLQSLRLAYFLIHYQISVAGIESIDIRITNDFPGVVFEFISLGSRHVIKGRSRYHQAERTIQEAYDIAEGKKSSSIYEIYTVPLDLKNFLQFAFPKNVSGEKTFGLSRKDVQGETLEEQTLEFLIALLRTGPQEHGIAFEEKTQSKQVEDSLLTFSLRKLLAKGLKIIDSQKESPLIRVVVNGYDMQRIYENGEVEVVPLILIAQELVEIFPTLNPETQKEAGIFLADVLELRLREKEKGTLRNDRIYRRTEHIQSLLPTSEVTMTQTPRDAPPWRFEGEIIRLKEELQNIFGEARVEDLLLKQKKLEGDLEKIRVDIARKERENVQLHQKYQRLIGIEENAEGLIEGEGSAEELKKNLLEKIRSNSFSIERDALEERRLAEELDQLKEKVGQMNQRKKKIERLESYRSRDVIGELEDLETKIHKVLLDQSQKTLETLKAPPVQTEEKAILEKFEIKESKTTVARPWVSFLTSLKERLIFRILRWGIVLYIVFSSFGLHSETIVHVIRDQAASVAQSSVRLRQTVETVPAQTLFWVPSFVRGFRRLEMMAGVSRRASLFFHNVERGARYLQTLSGMREFRPNTLSEPDSAFENGRLRERGVWLAQLSRGGGFYSLGTYSSVHSNGAVVQEVLDFPDAPLSETRMGEGVTVTMYFQGSEISLFRTSHSRVDPSSIRVNGRTEGFNLVPNSYGDATLRLQGFHLPVGYNIVSYHLDEFQPVPFTPSSEFIAHYTQLPESERNIPPTLRARLDALRMLDDYDLRLTGVEQIMQDRFEYGLDEDAARMFAVPPEHWLDHGFEEESFRRRKKIKAACAVLAMYEMLLLRYVGIPARLVHGAIDVNSSRWIDISELHAICQTMNPRGGRGWVNRDPTTFVRQGDRRLQVFQESVIRQHHERDQAARPDRTAGQSNESSNQAPLYSDSDYPEDLRQIYSLRTLLRRTDIYISQKLEIASRAVGAYENVDRTIDFRLIEDMFQMVNDVALGLLTDIGALGEENERMIHDLFGRVALMAAQKLADGKVVDVGNGDAFRAYLIRESRRWGLNQEIANTAFDQFSQGLTPVQRSTLWIQLEGIEDRWRREDSPQAQYQAQVARARSRGGYGGNYDPTPAIITAEYLNNIYAPLHFGDLSSFTSEELRMMGSFLNFFSRQRYFFQELIRLQAQYPDDWYYVFADPARVPASPHAEQLRQGLGLLIWGSNEVIAQEWHRRNPSFTPDRGYTPDEPRQSIIGFNGSFLNYLQLNGVVTTNDPWVLFMNQHVRPLMGRPRVQVIQQQVNGPLTDIPIQERLLAVMRRDSLEGDLMRLPMRLLADPQKRQRYFDDTRRIFLSMSRRTDSGQGDNLRVQMSRFQSFLFEVNRAPISEEAKVAARSFVVDLVREERRNLRPQNIIEALAFYQNFFYRAGVVDAVESVLIPVLSVMIAEDILAMDPDFRNIDQELRDHGASSELDFLLKVFGLYHQAAIPSDNFYEVGERFLEYLQNHPVRQITLPGIWAARSDDPQTVMREFGEISTGLSNIELFHARRVIASGDLTQIRALFQRYQRRYHPVRLCNIDIPYTPVSYHDSYYRSAAQNLLNLAMGLGGFASQEAVTQILTEAEVSIRRGSLSDNEKAFYISLISQALNLSLDAATRERLERIIQEIFPSLSVNLKLQIFVSASLYGSFHFRNYVFDQVFGDLGEKTPQEIRQILGQENAFRVFSIYLILHWQDFLETRAELLAILMPIALEIIPAQGFDTENYLQALRQMGIGETDIMIALSEMIVSEASFVRGKGDVSELITPEIAFSRMNLQRIYSERAPFDQNSGQQEVLGHRPIERVFTALLQTARQVIEEERTFLDLGQDLPADQIQKVRDRTQRELNVLLEPIRLLFGQCTFPSNSTFQETYEQIEQRVQVANYLALKPYEILRFIQLSSDIITRERLQGVADVARQQRIAHWRAGDFYISSSEYQASEPSHIDVVDHYLIEFWGRYLSPERKTQILTLYREGRLVFSDSLDLEDVQLSGNQVIVRRDFLIALVALRDAISLHPNVRDERGEVLEVRRWTGSLYERVIGLLALPSVPGAVEASSTGDNSIGTRYYNAPDIRLTVSDSGAPRRMILPPALTIVFGLVALRQRQQQQDLATVTLEAEVEKLFREGKLELAIMRIAESLDQMSEEEKPFEEEIFQGWVNRIARELGEREEAVGTQIRRSRKRQIDRGQKSLRELPNVQRKQVIVERSESFNAAA